MRAIVFACAAALLLSSSACDNTPKDKPQHEPATEPVAPPTPQAAMPGVDAGPAVVELQIASVLDTMTYDKTQLTVPAGSTVHLVLKNNSKLEVLPHNWVLVKPGTEAAVALAGMERPDAGYIGFGPSSDILAHTTLAPRGQNAEVTFTAPPAGNYPYICTVPGHYVMMKGVLTVTP